MYGYSPPGPLAFGYSDEISAGGSRFIRDRVVKKRVAEAHDKGRKEVMLLLKQYQDIEAVLNTLQRENEIDKSVMNTELEHFKDHIRYVKSQLQKGVDDLRDERYMLKEAIKRDRKVYLEQRKREHRPVFGPGAIAAIAASATIVVMQLLLMSLV